MRFSLRASRGDINTFAGAASVITLILMFIIGIVILFIQQDDSTKKGPTYRVYLAAVNSAEADQAGKDIISFLKRVELGEKTSPDLIKKATDDSYFGEVFTAAVDNWKEINKLIADPKVGSPLSSKPWSAGDAWITFLLISLCVAVFVFHVVYFIFWSEMNDDHQTIFSYPWTRAVGVLVSPFMLPWIVVSQPVMIIIWLVSEARAEARAREEDKKQSAEEKDPPVIPKSQLSEMEEAKATLEESRKTFVKIFSSRFEKKKEDIEADISELESKSRRLSRDMESNERSLAEKERELIRVEEDLKNWRGADMQVTLLEFERLLKLDNVVAVRVTERQIKVWTDTIYIPYERRAYQIGAFLLTVDIDDGDIRMKNLSNTCKNGDKQHPYGSNGNDFCFGNLSGCINEFFEERNYVSMISAILTAMSSAEGDNPDKVKNWRRVRKNAKKRMVGRRS